MSGQGESCEEEWDCPDYDDQVEEYVSSIWLKLLSIFILFIVCVAFSIYSLTVYGDGMSVQHMLDVLIGHINGEHYAFNSPEWFDDITIWEFAVPRLIFTLIAGIGLAVAGASMQSAMNNPLADPYTAGVSSGACLGMAIALVIGFSVNTGGLLGIIIISFLFSILPLLAIILLAPKMHSSPSTLILAGVALSYLFNALNTIIMVTVDAETLETIYKWQVGTLTQIRWDHIPFTLVTVTFGSAVIAFLSKQLNLLSMGDASATSLGVDPDNLRIICLMMIAFIVGAVVGSAGVIGFVGLVTPHLARMLLGSDNRYVIPASALMSVLLMEVADVICRSVGTYDNMPVGAVLGLIGAPIFLYLIMRRNSRVW